jgi:hypothetical protein
MQQVAFAALLPSFGKRRHQRHPPGFSCRVPNLAGKETASVSIEESSFSLAAPRKRSNLPVLEAD